MQSHEGFWKKPMPRNLSFKEALARQGDARDQSLDPSDFPTVADKTGFLLFAVGISQPVSVAKTLVRLGMPLRRAHAALNRLALSRVAAVHLDTAKAKIAVKELGELGVVAAKIVLPDPDVKRIRESYGHSQAEFAIHFGLQLDAIRNWEQGRNHPDPSARLLLRVIEKCPQAVEYALTDYSASLHIETNEGRPGG